MYNMTRKSIYYDSYRPLQLAFILPQPKRLKVGCYFSGVYIVLNLTKLHAIYIYKGSFYQYRKQQTGNSTRCCVRSQRSCRIFHCFFGGRGPPWRNLNFLIFRKKQSAMELFISIFENSSPKGSLRQNQINHEILQVSADSRYLQSGPLKMGL